MKKDDVFKMLKILDEVLPRESYSVVYGAALVINGVKEETHDIDINVEDPAVFQKLLDEGYELKYLPTGAKQISINEFIDLHLGGMKVDKVAVKRYDGYRVATVESVRDEKLLRGREKDLKDVEAINKWLSEH